SSAAAPRTTSARRSGRRPRTSTTGACRAGARASSRRSSTASSRPQAERSCAAAPAPCPRGPGATTSSRAGRRPSSRPRSPRATPFRGQVVLRASSGAWPLPWDLHVVPYQTEPDELLVFVFAMAPLSRGQVDLRRGEPRIRFRFFEGAGRRDEDALLAGVGIARAVAARFAAFAVETDPGEG